MLGNAIKDGTIHSVAVQSPFNMGYLAIKTAVAVSKGQKVEAFVDTAVTLVNKENINTEEIQKLINP